MITIIYHSADLDGHCSGAILRYYLESQDLKLGDDFVMVGWDYSDDIPWKYIDGHEIYMADISFQPWDQMVDLFHRAKSVRWIDHHISAIKEYRKWREEATAPELLAIRQALLVDGTAACRLCWQSFMHDQPEPEAVRLLGLFDVWEHHEDEQALPFQYGMRVKETTPFVEEGWDLWRSLFEPLSCDYVTTISDDGRLILEYQDQQNQRIMKGAHMVRMDGLRFMAVNAGGINSLAFEDTFNVELYDGAMTYSRKGPDLWTISLYSIQQDRDLSVVAKARGGGGHPSACGFQVGDDEMMEILQANFTN